MRWIAEFSGHGPCRIHKIEKIRVEVDLPPILLDLQEGRLFGQIDSYN